MHNYTTQVDLFRVTRNLIPNKYRIFMDFTKF